MELLKVNVLQTQEKRSFLKVNALKIQKNVDLQNEWSENVGFLWIVVLKALKHVESLHSRAQGAKKKAQNEPSWRRSKQNPCLSQALRLQNRDCAKSFDNSKEFSEN